MADSTQETPQAVYFLCDVSVRMDGERLALAESLIGRLADGISEDPLLKVAVRWGIEHYGTGAGPASVLPLQQVDFTDTLPAMRTTVEEPVFVNAARAMTTRMGTDISQLDADFPQVRSPILIVITSGYFAESPAELNAAVADLLTENPRIDQRRGWDPVILIIGIRAEDRTPIDTLRQAHDAVVAAAVDREADSAPVARWAVGIVRRAVLTGARHLRYAHGVIEEKDLVIGATLDRGDTSELLAVDRHPVSGIGEPLAYRRFLDTGQDADTHRLDDLLDLVALTAPPTTGGESAGGAASGTVGAGGRDAAEGKTTNRGAGTDGVGDGSSGDVGVSGVGVGGSSDGVGSVGGAGTGGSSGGVGSSGGSGSGSGSGTVDASVGDGRGFGERVLWPVRVVVGDDPRVASGVLVLGIPTAYSIGISDLSDVDRVRACADLAATIDLAHGLGVALGERALDSVRAARPGRRDVRTLLTDCADARAHASADSDRDRDLGGDLAWLGRFVERHVPLDRHGHDLAARAKSNAPSAFPSASRWRDYLIRRAAELQGPPVIEEVGVETRVAPVGAQVTVRWRTRHADRLTLLGPDGTRVAVPAHLADTGEWPIMMGRPGPVTVVVGNRIGERQQGTAWIHLFDLPRLGQVPIAAVPPTTPPLDGVAATWARLPALRAPGGRRPIGAFGGRRPIGAFPYDVGRWFFHRPTRSRFRFTFFRRFPWG